MSFVPHTPTMVAQKVRNTGVSACLFKLREAPAKMWLTFVEPAMDYLEWEYGDRFDVLLGQSADHGKVRIRRHPKGAAELRRRKNGKDSAFGYINLGVVPQYPDAKRTTAPCTLKPLSEGWMEVTLPAWADETAPTGLRRIDQTRSTPRAGTTSTGALMGDPDPERSALAKKRQNGGAL